MSDQPSQSALRTRYLGIIATPLAFLSMMAFINMLGYSGWATLFNNFAKEAGKFTGAEIGIAQSVREIPGFLAFTAIYWFMVMREQRLGYISLLVLGGGIAATGYFPTLTGLLITTFIMSVGFHYYETVNQSLSLQLFPKKDAPRLLGKVAGWAAVAQFTAYGGIMLMWLSGVREYGLLFGAIGIACLALTILGMAIFPRFQGEVVQNKGIILRSRYWLYYALTLMNGARRQIFTVFAGFLLVERFGFKVPDIALLLLVTAGLNVIAAPAIGRLVSAIGEKHTITFENIMLIVVFIGYTVTKDWRVAAALYVVDGVASSLAIAQKTYMQKIGDPADMAPTAAVAFTINHIAAVVIPVIFGALWLKDPAIVFYAGTIIASMSLILSIFVPRHPGPGQETTLTSMKLRSAS